MEGRGVNLLAHELHVLSLKPQPHQGDEALLQQCAAHAATTHGAHDLLSLGSSGGGGGGALGSLLRSVRNLHAHLFNGAPHRHAPWLARLLSLAITAIASLLTHAVGLAMSPASAAASTWSPAAERQEAARVRTAQLKERTAALAAAAPIADLDCELGTLLHLALQVFDTCSPKLLNRPALPGGGQAVVVGESQSPRHNREAGQASSSGSTPAAAGSTLNTTLAAVAGTPGSTLGSTPAAVGRKNISPVARKAASVLTPIGGGWGQGLTLQAAKASRGEARRPAWDDRASSETDVGGIGGEASGLRQQFNISPVPRNVRRPLWDEAGQKLQGAGSASMLTKSAAGRLGVLSHEAGLAADGGTGSSGRSAAVAGTGDGGGAGPAAHLQAAQCEELVVASMKVVGALPQCLPSVRAGLQPALKALQQCCMGNLPTRGAPGAHDSSSSRVVEGALAALTKTALQPQGAELVRQLLPVERCRTLLTSHLAALEATTDSPSVTDEYEYVLPCIVHSLRLLLVALAPPCWPSPLQTRALASTLLSLLQPPPQTLELGPSPLGPSPLGPSPLGPSPLGPSPLGPSPPGPSPLGPSPLGPSLRLLALQCLAALAEAHASAAFFSSRLPPSQPPAAAVSPAMLARQRSAAGQVAGNGQVASQGPASTPMSLPFLEALPVVSELAFRPSRPTGGPYGRSAAAVAAGRDGGQLPAGASAVPGMEGRDAEQEQSEGEAAHALTALAALMQDVRYHQHLLNPGILQHTSRLLGATPDTVQAGVRRAALLLAHAAATRSSSLHRNVLVKGGLPSGVLQALASSGSCSAACLAADALLALVQTSPACRQQLAGTGAREVVEGMLGADPGGGGEDAPREPLVSRQRGGGDHGQAAKQQRQELRLLLRALQGVLSRDAGPLAVPASPWSRAVPAGPAAAAEPAVQGKGGAEAAAPKPQAAPRRAAVANQHTGAALQSAAPDDGDEGLMFDGEVLVRGEPLRVVSVVKALLGQAEDGDETITYQFEDQVLPAFDGDSATGPRTQPSLLLPRHRLSASRRASRAQQGGGADADETDIVDQGGPKQQRQQHKRAGTRRGNPDAALLELRPLADQYLLGAFRAGGRGT